LARGWCQRHYARWYITGSTTLAPRPSVDERFWRGVEIRGQDECWPRPGNANSRGYGRFHVSHRVFMRSNRMAWILTKGQIPPGQKVLHSCDNPPCVNPRHLFLGSDLDNALDRNRKGRQARGERQGAAKLTEDGVREIRRAVEAGESQRAIARRLGVVQAQVSRVHLRKSWRHVES